MSYFLGNIIRAMQQRKLLFDCILSSGDAKSAAILQIIASPNNYACNQRFRGAFAEPNPQHSKFY